MSTAREWVDVDVEEEMAGREALGGMTDGG